MGPSGASGGMTTCTRWPSGMRAFTIGDDSSTRLPSGPSTRSISARSWAWLENARSLRIRRPCRSKNTSPGPFTMISVMVGSASNGCKGPKPNTSSISCSDSLDRRKASVPCHTGSANAWRHAPNSSLRARAGSNAINAAMSFTDTNRRTSSFRRASVAAGAWPSPPPAPNACARSASVMIRPSCACASAFRAGRACPDPRAKTPSQPIRRAISRP